MMKTLFLHPPSYEGFDGGAGSRYQARREIRSFWYPTWLAQPAALVPGSRLVDAPPAGQARSDTRTSGSRASLGSASPRLHRIRRTTAPAGKVYASCFRLSDRNQGSIGTYFVAPTMPADYIDKEAGDIDGERQQIARGPEPPAHRAHAQSMINLQLQHKPAGDGCGNHGRAKDDGAA